VVDGDDRELGAIALHWDVDGGLVKCGVDVVDWDGVVRVGGIATDITDYAEFTAGRLEALQIHEWGNRLGQVDAIDEYVRLDNLGIRSGPL
jgi:hypothetical protein